MTLAPETQGKGYVLEYSERKFLPHGPHDGHHYEEKGHSTFEFEGDNLCCGALTTDFNDDTIKFGGEHWDTLGFCFLEQEYESGKDYRSTPINFCPYCGVKFEYKRVKLTEIEQKCTTTVKEVKETHCTPVETEREP